MKVLVTGASMGIGRELALAWAARKATVILSARGREGLEETAALVRERGGTATIVVGDVTHAAHREELAKACEGSLDVLVNNAGRGLYAPIDAIALDAFREVIELNVVAPLAVTQALLPALTASRGTVVMMSSIAGIVAAPKLGGYAATKFALEALSMAMRAELADRGISVVVIRPGPVDTPFRDNAKKGEGTAEYDAPDPKAQKASEVAALTVKAVDRKTAIVETSALVKVAGIALRFAPPILRRSLRKMAKR